MRIGTLGGIAAFAWLMIGSSVAMAEPVVTLTSLDGATQVEGELLDFDGATYRLRTGVGVINIDATQVTCAGEGCPATAAPGGGFGIAGSNVIGDGLVPALIEGYADGLNAELLREVGAGQNEQVFRILDAGGTELAAIELSAHGTTTAWPALADGSAALGLASSRMAGPEPGLSDLRDSPSEHILALDGVIVIAHTENPVRALTLDQVAGIFAGRIVDWAELGGNPGPISLYVPDERSGTRKVFEDLVLNPRGVSVAASAEPLEDHADLSDLVSIDPGGIGVTGFGFARGSRTLAIRQECGLVSAPTAFSMKTEEYPLGRRLYAYDAGRPLPAHAKAFLDYALSDAAQPVIAEAGFVDRGIEFQGIDAQGERLANSLASPEDFSLPLFREMLGELRDGQRLSVTFRFTPGSSNLETRSQAEAERFARELAAGAFAGKDILLVGFTDSVGDFNVNRGLAERRAQSVLETFRASVAQGALDNVPVLIQSYGELTPVGCNETPVGRELNRRVEVWVRDHRD